MKKVLAFLLKYKKRLIQALIVIIFIVFLAASTYKITIDDGTYKEGDFSSTPYAASTYTKDVKIGANGIETTQTAEELWEKMDKNNSTVSKYLNTYEELEKLMKAEIVTQYPKIGVQEEGKLDGIIEFKRAIADGSSINGLTYVDEETFNSYIEKYNTDGNDVASKYFTIDSAGNVLMSQWTKVTTVTTVSQNGSSSSNTEVSYSMTTTSINYKSVVQKYSMPFDYLWAFLLIGGHKDLSLELADYVLEDSQIEITGFENKTSATDLYEESEQVEVQVPVEVTDPETGEKTTETRTETQTKTTTIETTVESNNVTADLTVADTWLIDYAKDYKYENDHWVAGEVKSDPKVDKDSEKKNEGRNFVTILNRHYRAKDNITKDIGWLFEILETNTSTANMVDLTKYLLYKATGTNYGVDDDNFNFDEYENNAFVSGDYGIYGNSIQEKVWFALKNLGYRDEVVAGAMGNIDYESGGFNANAVEKEGTGIGLIQWSFGRADQLRAYANSKGAEWTDVDTQIEFLIAEISGQGPAASIASKRTSGYIGDEGVRSTSSQWENSTSIEDATLHFMRFFESPAQKASYGERLRRAQKYFNNFKGMEAPDDINVELTGDNKTKMEALLKEAQRIANDNRYTYSQSNRNSEFQYDCTSFVARLYKKFFGIITPSWSGAYGEQYRLGFTSNVKLQPGDVLWRPKHVTLYLGNGKYAAAHGQNGYYATHPEAQISVYNDSPNKYTYVYRFVTQ